MQQKYINECGILIKVNTSIELNGVVYDYYFEKFDNVFAAAIEQTFIDYIMIGRPIVDRGKLWD